MTIFDYVDTQVLWIEYRMEPQNLGRFQNFDIFDTDKIRIGAKSVKNQTINMSADHQKIIEETQSDMRKDESVTTNQ